MTSIQSGLIVELNVELTQYEWRQYDVTYLQQD